MDTAKLQNRTQEIAIHSDHRKIEFNRKGRVSIESRLLPKMIREEEVNSKNEKKSFLQKLIYLANAFQNAFEILLLDKLWRMLLSEIFWR